MEVQAPYMFTWHGHINLSIICTVLNPTQDRGTTNKLAHKIPVLTDGDL